jgi:hypothetical protein
MIMRKKYFISFFVMAAACVAVLPFAAKAAFDPNNIISDQEMLDAGAMSLGEIDSFLNSQGGYIATNNFTDAFGATMSAAQIIYNAAYNFECDTIEQYRSYTREQKMQFCRPATVNPKFLIVLLQKEQSLITEKTPTQKQLDWATGYGVCDSCSMDDPAIQRWKGFGKQINSAALQFFDYVKNPHLYRYKAGQTYTVTNTGQGPSVITPANNATAGLYNYTPHVYNGNFNFWKLWQRYFTRDYLNGSLLQVAGESGVWLIENGVKRPFMTRSALTSRYDPSRIQIVSRADLDKYETGAPIKFAQYSIIRIPNGRIYLLVDDHKRRFANPEAFKKMGFNPDEIINASESEIAEYAEGSVITTTSTYPTGSLLQDKATGGVFWVEEGIKHPLLDASLLRTKFKNKRIIRTTAKELSGYTTGDPIRLSDGDIVRTAAHPAVYIIENGLKRPVLSADAFIKLGYKWSNIFVVSDRLMNLHADGEAVVVTQ